jgi:flavin reductase (DIM6/NTAB) family NADH-FMN oxidoreductase RutF
VAEEAKRRELNRQDFAQAIETVRSGLYVVTSQHNNELAGCTCVWVSRVSFQPPLMGVVLSPMRFTYRTIEASKRFCINVLGESGIELARRFGFHNGPPGSKFAGVGYKLTDNGSPLLDAAVSWFDCRLAESLPIGDHKLMVGEVLSSGVQRTEQAAVYVSESFFADDEPAIAAEAGAH